LEETRSINSIKLYLSEIDREKVTVSVGCMPRHFPNAVQGALPEAFGVMLLAPEGKFWL
jgi:hypothetical protein